MPDKTADSEDAAGRDKKPCDHVLHPNCAAHLTLDPVRGAVLKRVTSHNHQPAHAIVAMEREPDLSARSVTLKLRPDT